MFVSFAHYFGVLIIILNYTSCYCYFLLTFYILGYITKIMKQITLSLFIFLPKKPFSLFLSYYFVFLQLLITVMFFLSFQVYLIVSWTHVFFGVFLMGSWFFWIFRCFFHGFMVFIGFFGVFFHGFMVFIGFFGVFFHGFMVFLLGFWQFGVCFIACVFFFDFCMLF